MLGVFWKCLFTSLVAGLLSILVRYLWELVLWNRRRNLPPGPRGLPLLGYLPFMPKDGHRGIERLRKKYGNVFGLRLGRRYVAFLCDFASVKEALSQDALLNRPEEFPLNVNKGTESMLVLNGPSWKEQRRFSKKAFKELAGVTQSVETSIHRLAHDDPECARLNDLISLITALGDQGSALNFIPWLRKLLVFFRLGTYGRLADALIRRDRFSDAMVDFHVKTYEEGVVRDYIDAFLGEMKQKERGRKSFTRNVLTSNVSSFMGAGSDVVRTALEWLLLTCAAKPDLQSRIQAEIDAAVQKNGGHSRIVWKDRGLMPYTQAFMWETMRCKPVNPLGIMRSTSDDVKVGGYVIPQGSIVVPALWCIFHDASIWGDPEVFRPERFLTYDGTRASKPEQLIPFSYGKRSCPGEGIANMEVFIFFTTILRHFTVEPPPDARALVFDEKLGLTLRPTPQELVFKPRGTFS